ncbi:hypothetical protein V6R21_17755 [Limibacter armeniacum]|uniref:hypothetical protein n=1 Tax=Limibacter armeniacum TaxID=466084 RepID=UPI002FE50078
MKTLEYILRTSTMFRFLFTMAVVILAGQVVKQAFELDNTIAFTFSAVAYIATTLLKATYNTLKNKLEIVSDYQKQVDSLKTALEEAQQIAVSVANSERNLKAEKDSLEQDLKLEKSAHTSLKSRYNEIHQSCIEQEKANSEMRRQLNNMGESEQSLQSANTSLNSRLNDFKNKVAELEENLEDADRTLAIQREQISELNEQKEELNTKYRSAQNRLNALKGQQKRREQEAE